MSFQLKKKDGSKINHTFALLKDNYLSMIKSLQLQLPPSIAFQEQALKKEIQQQLSLDETQTVQLKLHKRSIDARAKQIKVNLSLDVFIDEPVTTDKIVFDYKDVSKSKNTCHIIGCGPAGLFAALKCIELGIKPIIFERGKNVKDRRRDLAAINKEHLVNPESNYCFGEGGAGTYSDGKLYTRSHKRGSIDSILKTLVYHGASEEIMIDAHPHIGTNKLPQLIQAIRETIIEHGGEVHFDSKLIDFNIRNSGIKEITVRKNHTQNSFIIQNLIL
ncbi:MAG: NAD(P)/FAD-dependent oxidoreductase, partial [Bacteroidia bacterium]